MFHGVKMEKVYIIVLCGLFISFLVSKLELPGKNPVKVLFALSFLITVPMWQESELILDASRYFLQAKHFEIFGAGYFIQEWGGEISTWTDMPLIPFLYGMIFKVFGEHRICIQILNTFLFSSTVVITFLIGKELWDEERGFYAGLLILGVPYLFTQVPLLLVDIATMFMVTASYYLFILAIRRDNALFLMLSPVSICLALLTKYSALLLLAPLPLFAFVISDGGNKEILRKLFIISIGFLLFAGVAMLLMWDVVLSQIEILLDFQAPRLGSWGESHVSTFLFQSHPFITVFASLGVYNAFKSKDRKFLITVWIVVVAFFLEIKRIRYILPLFPMLTVAASYGLCSLEDREARRFAGVGIVAVTIVVLYSVYLPFLNRVSTVNLKEAGAYLDTINCKKIGIYALPQKKSKGSTEAAIPLLDIFTKKELINLQNNRISPTDSELDSSLRFTWELNRSKLYKTVIGEEKMPIVVISGEKLAELPEEILKNMISTETMKRFDKSTSAFRYKTIVNIFGKDCPSLDVP
jgi:4-amino-4-deoxy-L-arabinose transferase-like glycosyltransferase